ncbi:MAG TPA: aminodeoxychorismate/anthranilate synthase component II [bacterium]|nr:aminodeoxychorismate/anthranilate synthase component II [bacterium]
MVQLLGELGATIEVVENDEIDPADVKRLGPDGVLISPGPCTPNEAGASVPVIRAHAGKVPILGVCLGHQSIGAALGGTIVRAQKIMHGKTSPILHDGRGVFEGLSNPFDATRYHSLVIERATLPKDLAITAWTADGEIMGVRHTGLPEETMLEGVQFHPESILTAEGRGLIANWLSRLERFRARGIRP